MSNTQTPRTDAAETNWWSEDGLRSAFIVRADFARELEREIARITAERDEARREICHDTNGISPTMVAEDRGWDCFKENNND